MAEAIGLVASIIGVMQLAQAVTSAAYKYSRAVKNAPKDTQQLASELTSLVGTLGAVRDVAEDDPEGLGSLTQPGGPLQVCTEILQKIESKLIPKPPSYTKIAGDEKSKTGFEKEKERTAELLRKLLWPFKEEETKEMIGRLERAKGVLMLSLTADQSVVIKEVRKLAEETNQSTRETLYLVNQISDAQVTLKNDLEAQRNDEKRLEVIRWLFNGVDHTFNQKAASKLRHEGTGEWFLERSEFQAWLHETTALNIWLYGIPGAGKTVLLSTAIEATISAYAHSNIAVIYFYFTFNDTKKQDTQALLCSLCAQLCQLKDECHPVALSLFEEHRKNGLNSRPTIPELTHLLRELCCAFPNVLILIDALDECTTRGSNEGKDGLLEVIHQISGPDRTRAIPAKFLFTSRKETDIEEVLNELEYKAISIRSDSVKHDVRIYATEVVENSFARRFKAEVRREIVDALSEGAHGMFRWVACQIDVLKKCRTPKTIRDALKSLPETLDSTYDRILQDVESRGGGDAEIARRALLWLVHATRPLRTGELAEAISVEIGSECLDEDLRLGDPADPEYENMVGNIILEVCGSLVRVQGEDEFIMNIRSVFNKIASRSNSNDIEEQQQHQSLNGVSLGSNNPFSTSSGGNMLAEAAGAGGPPRVRFVRSPSITSDPLETEKKTPAATLKIVLSHYSVKEYLISSRLFNSPIQGIRSFSLHDSSLAHKEILRTCLTYLQYTDFTIPSKRIVVVPDVRRYWGIRSDEPLDTKSIIQLFPLYHYAANHWMNHVTAPTTDPLTDAQHVLLKPEPTMQFECWTKACNFLRGPPTPLYCLAIWGFTAALIHAIDVRGADPNALNGVYKYPLQAAARFGRDGCVAALLQRGARVNATDWSSFTALHHAVLRHPDGDQSESTTVALLLDYGADVGLLSAHEKLGPLHMAIQRRLSGIVRQMLAVATVKDVIPGDDNILLFSMRSNMGGSLCADTTREILTAYPELVNSVDKEDGKSSLHYICAYARFAAVTMLKEMGAEIHPDVKDGVEVLLAHRNQIMSLSGVGKEGRSMRVLRQQEELERRSCEVLKVLIEEFGADVNARDAQGRSCYRYALLGGTEDDRANSRLTELLMGLISREQLRYL